MDEIHFLLGNDCNLNCEFCFWEKISDPSWKSIKYIIDEIVKSGIKKVTISGGEPTLSPYFLKSLTYGKKSGLNMVVHTNGIKIDKNLALKMTPLIDRVSLTINHKTGSRHTLYLINLFQNLNLPTTVKTLVTKVNQSEIEDIGKLLESKPIAYWSLLEFNPIGRGLINKNKFLLSSKNFQTITTKIINQFPQIKIKIRALKSQPEKYCFITTDKNVFTNTKFQDILIGNLKTNSLSEILKQL